MKNGVFVIFAGIGVVVLLFFWPVFLGKIPIPTDALVNLNYPLRDYFSQDYPRGVPYKNPLVTDPVLQQIPWRELSVMLMKKFELPLWNPYQMAGYPLLGNVQSAAFYPFNLLFFIFPFVLSWTFFIALQPFMAACFMYLFLKGKKLSSSASFFGGITFAFSGFMVSWLEWGTIGHTALWLPLSLFAVDKIVRGERKLWIFLFTFSLICSFLAGHLQTFVYSFGIVIVYSLFHIASHNQAKKNALLIGGGLLAFFLILSPIIRAQGEFILLSARAVDQSWQQPGWFIPMPQLMQFAVPNFFGNPATGNYWGEWNYGEFLGYVGIFPLFFALVALFKRSREVWFWGSAIFLGLLFATENTVSILPYQFSIPFYASTQPTRLIFLIDIALSILAAYGFEYVWKLRKKLFIPLAALLGVLSIGFIISFLGVQAQDASSEQWKVSLRNGVIPFGLMVVVTGFVIGKRFISEGKKKYILLLIIGITIMDLLYIAAKYTPFSSQRFYYPKTKIISFLSSQKDNFRIMATDRQILHPNLSTYYRLQSIEGYDPLYLLRYGELMSAVNRGGPDIRSPFGFQRIITISNPDSKIIDLLGVKYILSLHELPDPYILVMEEGQTRLYENPHAFPRVFFVDEVIEARSKQDAINTLWNIDLQQIAVIEGDVPVMNFGKGRTAISSYTENVVRVVTENESEGFLVLTDSYYPTWEALIDGEETKIYRTDYHFRGVIVPKGKHTVEFKNTL